MKKILIIWLLTIIPIGMSAQEKSFSKIYSIFEDRDGVETLNISPRAFAIFVPDSSKSEKELFRKMETLKIISVSRKCASTSDSLSKEIKNYVSNGGFEQVMKVKDSAEQLFMYHKDSELLFLAEYTEDVSVIYIKGTIDKDVMKAVMEGEISFK